MPSYLRHGAGSRRSTREREENPSETLKNLLPRVRIRENVTRSCGGGSGASCATRYSLLRVATTWRAIVRPTRLAPMVDAAGPYPAKKMRASFHAEPLPT